MTPVTPEVIPVLENVAGIRAFFTTRRGGFSEGAFASLNLGYLTGDNPPTVDRNWEILLHSQGLENRARALPGLCHGVGIREVSGSSDTFPENTDAVYTRDGNTVLAVTMGDCLAALIADPETRCIAAVHAGWRGSRDNILGKTLEHLFESALCRPGSTLVALGPCLSTEALEISEEVARTLPTPHLLEIAGRFFFDLRGCNRAQAVQAGIRAESIPQAGGCTRTDPERFFSHRRDGARSGRMAACIALI